MDLKERIRALAKSKGLSLPKLEIKLGFGNGTIVKWDKSIPNADKLTKVADYFNVSVDYLLGREDKENSSDMDLRRIERARNRMDPKDKEKMMKILEASFEDYFDDKD